MTWRDGVILAACLYLSSTLIWFRIVDATSLQYYPYTNLMPPFQPAVGAALMTLVLPVIVQRQNLTKKS
jgi:predicted N-acyltransferase